MCEPELGDGEVTAHTWSRQLWEESMMSCLRLSVRLALEAAGEYSLGEKSFGEGRSSGETG